MLILESLRGDGRGAGKHLVVEGDVDSLLLSR
jgi:hypothetical protein